MPAFFGGASQSLKPGIPLDPDPRAVAIQIKAFMQNAQS
jgi:hypothetical protein